MKTDGSSQPRFKIGVTKTKILSTPAFEARREFQGVDGASLRLESNGRLSMVSVINGCISILIMLCQFSFSLNYQCFSSSLYYLVHNHINISHIRLLSVRTIISNLIILEFILWIINFKKQIELYTDLNYNT
jgi:hypothetical protein